MSTSFSARCGWAGPAHARPHRQAPPTKQAPSVPAHTGKLHPQIRLRLCLLTLAGPAHKAGSAHAHPLGGPASDAAFHAALYVLGSGLAADRCFSARVRSPSTLRPCTDVI